MTDVFNAAGVSGRDCPLCFRTGSLVGARDGDAPKLTCSGCLTQFALTWSAVPGMPDSLTRIRTPQPVRKPEFDLTPPERST